VGKERRQILMGIYRKCCYKVEDLFVKFLSKKQDSDSVKEKVNYYRLEKERIWLQKKLVKANAPKESGQSQV
jgi:hypothetical protein